MRYENEEAVSEYNEEQFSQESFDIFVNNIFKQTQLMISSLTSFARKIQTLLRRRFFKLLEFWITESTQQ